MAPGTIVSVTPALAIAAHDRYEAIAGHVEQVGRHAAAIALRLGLGRRRASLLRAAATLHDFGKVAIPDTILLKPGPLTPAERRIMERHTEIGHELLAGTGNGMLDVAARIALGHHERWDGGGYPLGLAREEIPLDARIVAVADVFDSLTRARSYRAGLDRATALGVVRFGRGTQFDPDVVDAFLASPDRTEVTA